jgi:hypothetical protein
MLNESSKTKRILVVFGDGCAKEEGIKKKEQRRNKNLKPET